MHLRPIASLVIGACVATIIAAIPARARAGVESIAPAASAEPAPVEGDRAPDAANATSPAPPGRDPAAPPPSAVPSPSPPETVAPAAPAPAPTTPRLVASLSHDLQFGLAVLIGAGYRGVFPYHDNVVCGDAKAEDNRVCTNRAPLFVDLQPSFGISTAWDALVDVRLGLEKDFINKRQLLVMPGFRYWLEPEAQVKFFSTMQLFYDATGDYNPPLAPHPVKTYDLGFRNSNGLMIEIMRNFGVYAQFGETIGFVRWLSFAVDAGLGVQARVP